MNTTAEPNTSAQTPSEPRQTGRLSSLRTLGRGIVATSAVALLGVGTMSSADASAAGVAQGVRYAATASSTHPSATDLPSKHTRQLVVRDGKVRQL